MGRQDMALSRQGRAAMVILGWALWAQAACAAAACQPSASCGGEQGCPALGGWWSGPRAALGEGAPA